jgi:hypothetical protein
MTSPKSEPVPRRGIIVMAIVLLAMALLALYANVQKLRRNQIETVIVTPVATATPSPAAP